jgi:hypothetical protein
VPKPEVGKASITSADGASEAGDNHSQRSPIVSRPSVLCALLSLRLARVGVNSSHQHRFQRPDDMEMLQQILCSLAADGTSLGKAQAEIERLP